MKILGGETGDGHLQKAYIKLRICVSKIEHLLVPPVFGNTGRSQNRFS